MAKCRVAGVASVDPYEYGQPPLPPTLPAMVVTATVGAELNDVLHASLYGGLLVTCPPSNDHYLQTPL